MAIVTFKTSEPAKPTAPVVGANGATPPVPVAAPPVEPPKTLETPAAVVPKPSDDAMKFQQLARKEKVMREKQREMDAKEAAIVAREKEIESAKGWQMRLTNEPLKVLNEAGITYEQLTNHILSQQNVTDPQIVKLQSELETLRKQQEDRDLQAKDAQTKQYQNALKQISNDVNKLVKDNPTYELISSYTAQAGVTKLIEDTFNEDGILMSVEEASTEVENWLEEQTLLGVKSKKIQTKMTPPVPPADQKPVITPTKPLTTITNQIVQATTKPSTAEERRARAIAVAEGKLQPS